MEQYKQIPGISRRSFTGDRRSRKMGIWERIPGDDDKNKCGRVAR